MKKLLDLCEEFSLGRRFFFCILMASVNFSHADEFFNFAEFKTAANFTIPNENDREKTVSGNTGLRLSFRDADFRGFVTLPKTEFDEIRSSENIREKLDFFDNPRLGAGFFLFKKNFPTTIKIGHNSYSKSVSKLRNPSPPTTANPLAKSFAFSTGIGASLTSLTASTQPVSYSICTKSLEKMFPVQFSAESFVTEEKEGAALISAKLPLSRCVFLQSSISGGRYSIEGHSKILEKNNAGFEADYFYSGLGEFCFHSPLLKINFFTGIQENPYDVNPVWFRIDGRTSYRNLLLNFSYFAIPTTKDSPKAAPLIGAAGQICRTVEQASINPQILFLFDDQRASSLRMGFSALENWKVTATNVTVQLNTAKIRAAVSYESRFFDLRFDWTHANILLAGQAPVKSARPEEYQSYALSGSLAGERKISFSGSYTRYSPMEGNSALKEAYSADVKIASGKAGLTSQAGIDLTVKNGARQSGQFSAGLSYLFRRKYFRSYLKAGLIVPF